MHTLFVGGCGLAGTLVLWRGLRRVEAPRRALYANFTRRLPLRFRRP